MTTPHDKLRDACERTANAQVTFKAADAAGSGHVAAASVLMEACADLSTHIPTILSLLDENARLRAEREFAATWRALKPTGCAPRWTRPATPAPYPSHPELGPRSTPCAPRRA
jgi:hypothetical protein